MGLIRMHQPGMFHFITNRCEKEQFFLLPRKEINQIVLNCLVKAHALHGDGIEVYAFIFLANHFHMLIRNMGTSLGKFMGYFESILAKEVHRHWGEKGRFFSREYDDVIVDGDDAFLNRYCYVMGNAVKAGLVDASEEWPGINSIHHALTEEPYNVRVLNRSKYNQAKRHGKKVKKEDFIEEFEMKLAIPPMWEDKTQGERQALIKDSMASAEHKYHADRKFKPTLGAQKILEQKHTDRPQTVSRSPRFKVFCLDEERKKEILNAYREFVGSYREIFEGFRKAAFLLSRPTAEWPSWSYPPSCWSAVPEPNT